MTRPAVVLLFAAMPLFGQAPAFEGHWLGTLHAGQVSLRVVLHLAKAPGGGLSGTFDSLDQNALGIPASEVTAAGRSLTVQIARLGASFEGTLAEDGKQLAGTFKQAGAAFALTFAKVDKPPGTSRPQDPGKPYPYDEEEVVYNHQGVTLAGTLTLPRGKGPYPAVLLLTGSGPQDRNEAIMGHRPFLVWADSLTRRGIAVLRMDDRGVGGSSGSVLSSTEDDFATDALAGIAYLRRRPEIDPARTGLVGHSEGALVAAMAAARSAHVAFVVMLAGPGIPGDRLIVRQVEQASRAAGLPPARVAENAALQRKLLDIVMGEKDDDAALAKLRAALAFALAGVPDQVRTAKERELAIMVTPWYRSLLAADPAATLRKVPVPVLAINGELDTQVPADENLAAIAAALKEGGNRDFTTRKLPGLNHLFQKAATGAIGEYGKIEETANPAALEMVGQWITAHTALRR